MSPNKTKCLNEPIFVRPYSKIITAKSPQVAKRIIAQSLAVFFASSGMGYLQAATDIADVPLAVLNPVSPNVFITMDYSGSMTDPMRYDNTYRYRPWLFDGVLTVPQHGPVRLQQPNPASVCSNIWETLSILNYVTNSSGADSLSVGCRYADRVNVATMGSRPVAPTAPAAGRTDCGASCTQAQEDQNYANFLQFYNTRFKASRAAITESLGRQKYNVRVGFLPYSDGDGTTNITGIRLLDATPIRTATSPRYLFYRNTLLNTSWSGGGTPTRPALINVGEYFKTDAPYRDDPQSSNSPIRSCRANYNILLTDGYWNTGTPGMLATIGNADGAAAAPYRDNWGSGNATLADIAYYYYANDLKTNLVNNVQPTSKDPATHQHLVNYTVSMDIDGTVSKATVDAIFSWMNAGSVGAPPSVSWPDPISYSGNERIDDLAHAGVNSHGGYFAAKNPQQLTRAVMAALNDAIGKSSSAPVGLADVTFSPTEDIVAYVTGYDAANWTGTFQAYLLNPNTAEVLYNQPQWSPSADQKLENTYHKADSSHNNRIIVTWKGWNDVSQTGGKAIPFRPDAVRDDGTLLQTTFNIFSTNDGGAVINYLRGDKSNEGLDDANYRERASLMGDIGASGPVVVGVPKMQYREDGDGEDVGYPDFITEQTANPRRKKTVFVGANDGMLHAFDAATGKESWAYIPSFAYDCSLSGDTCSSANNVNYLRDLALPFGFQHRPLVDNQLLITDVDFDKTDGGSDSIPKWRTVLTSSLGKGGRGVFALDVTEPQASTESEALEKVLWEFPYRNASGGAIPEARNMGYSYARIDIGKVKIGSKQRWVAIVPSGYNNGLDTGSLGSSGDGKGHLFILDARTGRLIKDIKAGDDTDPSTGTPANPSGLAQVSARSDDQRVNHLLDAVYGGDLLGNLWRFDLSSHNTDDWKATKITTLVDRNNVPQPITTRPWIAEDGKGGTRWLFVGTGRYLGVTDRPKSPNNTVAQDLAAAQTQSVYGFIDPFQDGGNNQPISNLRSISARYNISNAGANGTTRTILRDGTAPPAAIGWYIDLNQYERVTINPKQGISSLAVAVNAPWDDACKLDGTGSLLVLPLNKLKHFESTSITAGYSFGERTVTGAALAQTRDGRVVIIATMSGGSERTQVLELTGDNPPPQNARRVYWRDLPAE